MVSTFAGFPPADHSTDRHLEKPGVNKGITLSAHEQELKRAEMARRRKNLTDQKLEEEKVLTVDLDMRLHLLTLL